MNKEEILRLLKNILAPLLPISQSPESGYIEFEEFLIHALAQNQLVFMRDSMSMVDANYLNPPPDSPVLEKIADIVMASQVNRGTHEAEFWLRERDFPLVSGPYETRENYLIPELSFGPFINIESEHIWFDFYAYSKQLVFETNNNSSYPRLIISLQSNEIIETGTYSRLDLNDCSIWIATNDFNSQNRNYIGLAAKNCTVTFESPVRVTGTGQVRLLPHLKFELIINPFERLSPDSNTDNQFASYPQEITFSFSSISYSLSKFTSSKINVNGNSIDFKESNSQMPVQLQVEHMVFFPLISGSDKFQPDGQEKEYVQLNGGSTIESPGWYLPIFTIDNDLGRKNLGRTNFSGFLGFRGREGVSMDWRNLEGGKLSISAFLILASPYRKIFDYSYGKEKESKQQFSLWKEKETSETRSYLKLFFRNTGKGRWVCDLREVEWLFQPVSITAYLDRPVNGNQERFELREMAGRYHIFKIKDKIFMNLFGHKTKFDSSDPNIKKRIPQSICLQNALLTTDNPNSIFLKGVFHESSQIIKKGQLFLDFDIFRYVNSLPDPYLSNQDNIFGEDFIGFKDLWRSYNDTLPANGLFKILSRVQWDNDIPQLSLMIGQNRIIGGKYFEPIDDISLYRNITTRKNLCLSEKQINNFDGFDIRKIIDNDLSNLVGSYGFLQWITGERCLVDVSGRANQWGVAIPVPGEDKDGILTQSLNYFHQYPFSITSEMELATSGRLARLFTLPHIQWEPVFNVNNPLVDKDEFNGIDVIYQRFREDHDAIQKILFNGTPTRISTAKKQEVGINPKKILAFMAEGFKNEKEENAIAAHFTLPFGMCAYAYFNPTSIKGLPIATLRQNNPAFDHKILGQITGGLQLHFESAIIADPEAEDTETKEPYFMGTTFQQSRQIFNPRNFIVDNLSILGFNITKQFNDEFYYGKNPKVPLHRIDFSGYGANIFSNWRNEKANYGQVSQVKFDVLIGRTAHEVVQIKSLLFPWAVPVVRSIVIQRKKTGLVTRYDSGWIAEGPGDFNFLSYPKNVTVEDNPYVIHPGTVKGIYDVTEIRDLPKENDIQIGDSRFSGVYFNGNVMVENVIKGALKGQINGKFYKVHSASQLGYVLLANVSEMNPRSTLKEIFPATAFRALLEHPKVGGSLGGPLNCVINIAGTGQRMQVSRVDVSADPKPEFAVAIRGTIELAKEGSWTVVKCLESKDVVPLSHKEAVPLIRNGKLTIRHSGGKIQRGITYNSSHHFLGDPKEISRYAQGGSAKLDYGLLQTTDTQKLLFRKPSFSETIHSKIFTDIPDLADSFSLLRSNSMFPHLSNTFSLPDSVREIQITGDGNGLKLDDALFTGINSLLDFIPPQLNVHIPEKFYIVNEESFKVYVQYGDPNKPPAFQIDLDSEAKEDAGSGERKKWEFINKNVSIGVDLGPLKPMLTLKGRLRAEAGKEPVFEEPAMKLGKDLEAVENILRILNLLSDPGRDVFNDFLKVSMGNSPDSWNYKMSIEQRIPIIQVPKNELITNSGPPPLLIEASLKLGVFFNLALSPDPKNLINPGAGVVFEFEGMLQVQMLSIGVAAVYGGGTTRVRAYVDLLKPVPQFDFTFGFGATVMVVLPVIGMVSITRTVTLTGNISAEKFLLMAGQMMRGVVSLAGGLLVVGIQIEGKGGVQKLAGPNADTYALFEVVFSLNASLAFVVSYNFTKRWNEEVKLAGPIKNFP